MKTSEIRYDVIRWDGMGWDGIGLTTSEQIHAIFI